MTTTTRRSFTDEFKREAVSLLASSGRPLAQVAKELGIQPSMLRSWRGAANRSAKPVAGAGAPSLVAAAASVEQTEIRRLRRELERSQMERDILKKPRWVQPVSATAWARVAPGVLKPRVFLGRVFSLSVIASSSSWL
jgi:transposase